MSATQEKSETRRPILPAQSCCLPSRPALSPWLLPRAQFLQRIGLSAALKSHLLVPYRSVQQTSIGGRKFWARLEEELDRAAAPASDLPPERKQKLINNVRVLAARWRPLIDALQIQTIR